ncbi:MAG: serine hydrolase [Planctomycetes bacterium]|nr:serine hydrolase [Planctomycetota bacterium]
MQARLHRPASLFLLLAASGPALIGILPAQAPITADFVTAVVERAQQQFDDTGLALAVVQDGEVVAAAAAGERSEGVALTTGSLFNIASCTKAFTAAGVALLVQEHRLAWDDRVVDHIPEFRMSDPWITAHMTVRDLLSHRCGLKTFAGDLLWYGSDYEPAEVLHRIEKLPITQSFGRQFGYQNLMYMVAGMVIERTTGQTWEQFVTDRFFLPLQMTHTRAAAQLLPADADKALPHIDGQPIVDHEFVAGKPAASIYSSVDELTAWMRMLLDGGRWQGEPILAVDSLREMWRPHVAIGGGSGASTADFKSYGLGWFLSLEGDKKVVEHDGGMPGFLSKVSLIPADRFGFVVLNNSNDGIVNEAIKRAIFKTRAGGDGLAELGRIAAIARRIHAGEATKTAQREANRHEGTKPSLELAAYAGSYSDEAYGPAEVTLEGDQLQLVLLPSRRRLFGAMKHWHHDTFRVDLPDRFLPFALIRFDLDHTGAISGFGIDCPIADFDFGALDFKRTESVAEARGRRTAPAGR